MSARTRPDPWAVEAATDSPNPKPIFIERREIVGAVHPGDGPETMLHAALHMAAEYVAEQAASRTDEMPSVFMCRVEFTYRGDTYALSVNADSER